jgi:hypothetical protein
MKLLWKLLRQHISIGQFFGFVFANLFGMIIVLAGYQFYNDVLPIFTSGDSFMKPNYIMVTKHIGMGNTLSGNASSFSESDIQDLRNQPFTEKIGSFTTTEYKVSVSLAISNVPIIRTEAFFESVPDDFIDVNLSDWKYTEGQEIVPIILPRNYVNAYNFSVARQRSLPQISEGLMSMIDVRIYAHGNGKEQTFKGKVVAFSSTLNAVLVPQAFIDWSNKEFAPEDHTRPSRLLMQVSNPADEKITTYFQQNGLEMESDRLNAEKTTYFLRLIVTIVMVIGLIISALSFYILMLSIYLLVQKNTEKLQNLLLIGYRRTRIALPYQLLTMALNVIVLLIATLAIIPIRNYYMTTIDALYPEIAHDGMLNTIILGIILLCVVTTLNAIIIRRKINHI